MYKIHQHFKPYIIEYGAAIDALIMHL
jgi:hypothetical protein